MARNPNRMQEAVEKLTGIFQNNASFLVTIQQEGTTISGVRATVGRSKFDVMIGDVMTAYQTRDYTINTSDLAGLIPKIGMLIIEENGNRYEASMPKGLNVFENFGPLNSATKIHTKGN